MSLFKPDNPVWHSLNEAHKMFSLTYDGLKCYGADFCPFGAFEKNKNVAQGIDEYSRSVASFFIVGEQPGFSSMISLKNELVCLQMIIKDRIVVEIREPIVKLENKHSKELYDLVNLVQPGYFKGNTMLLGDYFGIFQNDKLVAVTGERMKMNDFTEISAVVTHPSYIGRSFAKQLIARTVEKVLNEGKIPFLHVADTNTAAIRLYEKLGFTTIRSISFWNLERISADD
ncbi:MAG TPA: GNAT family N-acetyltransferase [Ferruginibacter sp.]|nr:GNAT family N-acetyltransferase [Ferruginibacter sp.]